MEQEMFNQRTDLTALSEAVEKIKQSLGKVIVGQKDTIDLLIAGLLADGHILLEGVPGVAKTLSAKLVARCISATFSRIQFTPDLMPSDVLGTAVFSPKTAEFQFRRGPIFGNIILVDEINRAPAKTQSALFEAMEERQITVDGNTYILDEPFMVLATQNPIEQEGTYPLPEAQLDRFMLKVKIGYPTLLEEKEIIRRSLLEENPENTIRAVVQPADILKARQSVKRIYMDEKIERYILDIVFATRFPQNYGLGELSNLIQYGASPRASVNLAIAGKANAFLHRRGFVIPEDIRQICPDILRHRIGLTYEAEAENVTQEDIITKILNKIEVP